jgi:hypothetical protein
MATKTELKILEILVSHPPTTDLWGEPIHAVDKATGWATTDSRKFVRQMLDRHLLRFRTGARNVDDPSAPELSLWWWEKGEAAEREPADQ